MDFTKVYHIDSYPTISPKRPELSQTGKTVIITGGAGGVGLAISRSFAEAGAARLVLVARRAAKLAEAKAELEKVKPSLEILTYACDIVDPVGVQKVWEDLKSKGVGVDVLALNAAIANTTPQGLAEDDLVSKVWSCFEVNVLSALRMIDNFIKQGPTKGKTVISINTSAVHLTPTRPPQLGYASSKTGLGTLMASFSDLIPAEDVQIISYHPGSVKSEGVLRSAMANAPIPWNTDTLPGDFAVWACSKEASFLHGRFVWCNWDVDEMKQNKDFAQPGFCRIGLQGVAPLTGQKLWGQMQAFMQGQS